MGAKAKKVLKKKLQKVSSFSSSQLPKQKRQKQTSAPASAASGDDFLPLEGGLGHKIAEKKEEAEKKKNTSAVLYIGRIPHGFYEKEMEAYFSQFGKIKRLRIARNKKTGKSKHYAFLEFESPEVAEVVADCTHNYLLFGHILQVHLIPSEHVHPKLWRGVNYRHKPLNSVQIEQKRQDKERTLEGHRKLVEKIMKRDKKRQKTVEDCGLDYECPEILGNIPVPKKIRFSDD